MYFSKASIVSFSLLASSSLVAGHGAIIGATGDAGGQGSAIGVDPATPRDGTRRNPFQQDSTRFRGDAAASCGETLGGGDNDVETGTAQVMSLNGDTLPQITPGGEVQMTVHQVNADGAGPYTCMIDATGTGTNWQPIQVTQNLPGNERGRNRDTETQDQPLTAAIPADQTCTGTVAGQENICMVRCENPARAGPFGGCVPVQMVQAAAANNTADAVDNTVDNTVDPTVGNSNQDINTPQVQAPQGNGNVQQGQIDTLPQNGNVQQGQIDTLPQNGNIQQGQTGNIQQGQTGNIQQGTLPQNQNTQLVQGQLPQQNGQLVNGQQGTLPQGQNTQFVQGQIPQQNGQFANNNQLQNIPQGQGQVVNNNGNFPVQGGGATTLARRAIRGSPALTNDDQEEEVDLLS